MVSPVLIHGRTKNGVCDDVTPTIGGGIDLGADYEKQLQDTQQHALTKAVVNDFRRRIGHITEYFKEEVPDYFAVGVRNITAEEKAKPSMYFRKHDKYDLIYAGLNEAVILKFLISRKVKDDGNFLCHSSLRKYYDAIQWGAGIRKEGLSSRFKDSMSRWLAAYQKQTARAKKDGKVASTEADPISFELFGMLNKWALEDGNIYALFWTSTQWNCMARCGSIDPLGFRNFKVVGDAHSVTYDTSKMDQEGKKCFPKHIYANHEHWYLCQWTHMGLYCMTESERLGRTDKFFLEKGNEQGTAAKKYNEQLAGVVNQTAERTDQVKLHCRPGHFNAYGLRKGSATKATSGTTQAPNLPSIAHRGEWSMGAVFDIYWQFLPEGDFYLGRVLAGLNPNLPSFKTLPPHWKLPNPMSNPAIKQAMEANFGPILTRHQGEEYDPTGLLLRCLACVVHHSDAIMKAIDGNLGHPLMAAPLFGPQSNLQELKSLITLEPTEGVMTTPTGIPPSVEMACQLEVIKNSLSTLVDWSKSIEERMREHHAQIISSVIEAVKKGIDENDIRSGNVSGSVLAQMLSDHQKKTTEELTRRIEQVLASIPGAPRRDDLPAPPTGNQAEDQNGRLSMATPQGTLFQYNGRYWGVPQNFKFPEQLNIEKALRLWLIGSKVSATANVRPYRMLRYTKTRGNLFPDGPNRQKFRVQWAQFFNFLEDAGLLEGMPEDTSTMTAEQLRLTVQKMWEILRERVSYCFLEGGKRKRNPEDWALLNWAKMVTASKIKECGTDSDKAYLGNKEVRKRKHAPRPTRMPKENPTYVHRQKRRHQSGTVTSNFWRPGTSGVQERIVQAEQAHAAATGTTAPTAAFAPHGLETNPRHLQWLIDTFGLKNGVKEVVLDAQGWGRRGKCAVVGCTLDNCVLEGRSSHRCDRCGIPVHLPCVERFHLRDSNDNNFCSEPCLNFALNPPQQVADL